MKSFFIVVLFFTLSFSYPVEDEGPAEMEQQITEGDMILTPNQKQILYKGAKTRNGITNLAMRWPGAIVYYRFTPSISSRDRSLIARSLKEVERSTCIRFKQASSSQEHFVLVTNNATGCFGYIGYLKTAGQQLNLASDCMYKGIIIHEFLHAVGFLHQQSSADRDSYIDIHLENVEPGLEHNFDKYSSAMVTNFGTRYDYGSLMHYGPYDFSKNGKPVITAKFSGGENMGQRIRLSKSDIIKINRMYNC